MKTVAFAGEVDFGKSTLVGKLLQETGALPVSRVKSVQSFCENKGHDFEPAFLLDCFEEERVQEKTWDFSEFIVKYKTKHNQETFRLIDTPGHSEFVHKMISGASHCDSSVFVCDASVALTESNLRHLLVLKALGTSSIIVAITKMDLVNFSPSAFQASSAAIIAAALKLNLTVSNVVPVSGKSGENLIERSSTELGWYNGPTLFEAISEEEAHARSEGKPADGDNRVLISVQSTDVFDMEEYKIAYCRIESGQLKIDTKLFFHNPGQEILPIKWSLKQWPKNVFEKWGPGDCIAIQLDQALPRGTILTDSLVPPEPTNRLQMWLAPFDETLIKLDAKIKVRFGFQNLEATTLAWNGTIAEFHLDQPILLWPNSPLSLRRISLPFGVGIIN